MSMEVFRNGSPLSGADFTLRGSVITFGAAPDEMGLRIGRARRAARELWPRAGGLLAQALEDAQYGELYDLWMAEEMGFTI